MLCANALTVSGALNVKLLFTDGSEQLLWTRLGAHGNVWQEGHCPVPQQIVTYQVQIVGNYIDYTDKTLRTLDHPNNCLG